MDAKSTTNPSSGSDTTVKKSQEIRIDEETRAQMITAMKMLEDMMKAEADKFKEEKGRHMTYSEMRERFG